MVWNKNIGRKVLKKNGQNSIFTNRKCTFNLFWPAFSFYPKINKHIVDMEQE